MKTAIRSFVLSCFCVLFGASLHANPLPSPPPEFVVSELMFEEDGNWVMELSNIWDYSHDMLDSVVITTSSERVKLDLSQYFTDYIDPSNVILFRNNDLDLPIRRAGDLIQVTTYSEAVH